MKSRRGGAGLPAAGGEVAFAVFFFFGGGGRGQSRRLRRGKGGQSRFTSRARSPARLRGGNDVRPLFPAQRGWGFFTNQRTGFNTENKPSSPSQRPVGTVANASRARHSIRFLLTNR